MPQAERRRFDGRAWLVLAGFVALCVVVSALGGLATQSSVKSWYPTLAKPGFNPPDWVFAPVWSALYLMIALAGFRVWWRAGFGEQTRAAFAVYGLQLALNLLWSVLFFGLREVGWALVEIVFLAAAIAVNIHLFRRHDAWAAFLLLPYLTWVMFATLLNGQLWRLN